MKDYFKVVFDLVVLRRWTCLHTTVVTALKLEINIGLVGRCFVNVRSHGPVTSEWHWRERQLGYRVEPNSLLLEGVLQVWV